MFRLITALATAAIALTLAASALAGNSWNAKHLPSPAPGYLPQTTITHIAFVPVREPRGFVYRDAAIGAAFGALVLAVLVGTVLVGIRARREAGVA